MKPAFPTHSNLNNNITTNTKMEPTSSQQQQQASSSGATTAAAASTSSSSSPGTHARVHNPYSMTGGSGNSTRQRSPQKNPTEQQQQEQEGQQQHQQQQNVAAASGTAAGEQQQQQQQQSSASRNLLDFPMQYHEHTLHKPLIGHVSFVPYPKTQVAFESEQFDPEMPDQYVRIFIGQLPYGITEPQLQWMSQVFGGGVTLYSPEVIIKNNKKTGCVHAKVRESQLKQLVAGIHKRVLVDDSGCWVGRTPQEIQVLTQYVGELKADPKKRYPDRCYDSCVVQLATSVRQQHHQGLPTIEEWFAENNGIY